MSLNYYISIAAGAWSYSAVSTSPSDQSDPVILIDPVTHAWGWESDLIPGSLEPKITTFTLAATSAAELPDLVEGDSITVNVDIDDANLVNTDGRVTDARIALDPRPGVKRPALLTVTIADSLADAAATKAPQIFVPGVVNQPWRERLAHIGYRAGVSLGSPSSWPDSFSGLELGMTWGEDKTLTQMVAEMCNSNAVGGVHHTLVPAELSSYPVGYEWVATGITWVGDPVDAPDPISNPRYLIVPASRYHPGTIPAQPEISARYCVIPTTARRGREHDINVVAIAGKALNYTAPRQFDKDGTYSHVRPGTANGVRTRSVPTQLAVNYYDDTPDDGGSPAFTYPRPAAYRAGQVFLTDPTAAGDRWVFDQIEIRSSDLDPTTAADMLPKLAPSYPTGPLVRRLTITDVESRAQITGDTVGGFITRGQMTIARGRITHLLNLTPGDFTTTNPHGA